MCKFLWIRGLPQNIISNIILYLYLCMYVFVIQVYIGYSLSVTSLMCGGPRVVARRYLHQKFSMDIFIFTRRGVARDVEYHETRHGVSRDVEYNEA